MKIYRYLISEFLTYSLIVFSVLFCILLGNYLSEFLDKAVNGYLNLTSVLTLLILISPTLILLLLPMSIFGGLFFTFRQLSLRNEIIILFFAKISWKKLFFYFLSPAIIVTCLSLFLSLTIAPESMALFEKISQNTATKSIKNLSSRKFYNLGNGETIYIDNNTINNSNELYKILLKKNIITITHLLNYSIAHISGDTYLNAPIGWEDTINITNASIEKANFKAALFNLNPTISSPKLTLSAIKTKQLFSNPSHATQIELRWRFFTALLPLTSLFLAFPFCANLINKRKKFSAASAIFCFIGFCALSSYVKNMLLTHSIPNWLGFELINITIIILSSYWLFLKNRKI